MSHRPGMIEHMYETGNTRPTHRTHRSVRREPGSDQVASEETVAYAAGGAVGGQITDQVGLAEAVKALAVAVDMLAGVDVACEADQTVLDAVVRLHTQANRLAGVQVAVVGAVDTREAYGADGAVTAASWVRARIGCNPGAAAAQVTAARRLRQLPEVSAALSDGRISWAHVVEITRAAIPARMATIQAAEHTLVELAEHAQPRDVRRAVALLRDVADPDGSDPTDGDGDGDGGDGRDLRRGAWLTPGIDGLWELQATLDTLAGEALAAALDALCRPDPADTADRRSPAQRRADAIGQLASDWLDRGDAPTRHGAKPHVVATIDLGQWLDQDAQDEVRAGRLRFTGDVPAEVIRRLVDADPKLTAVLMLGPWRVVNVGRTMRSLPAWLRAILQTVHRTCRGPDCDRPAVWGQAHHLHGWADGGHTDVNATIPLCAAHHDLITTGGWTAVLDLDTGVVTWTSPTGVTIDVHPT